MAIKDTSRQFTEDVQRDMVKKFTKAGLNFVSKLRGYVNTGQSYKRSGSKLRGFGPSAPGQFPHKLSGQLARSITWMLDKKKFVLTVGSNLKGYPSFLETGTKFMKSRPWLSKGFGLEKDTIVKILAGK